MIKQFYLIYRCGTLMGAATPGQSGPESNDTDGVLHNSKTGASSSNDLLSHQGHLLGAGSYFSVVMLLTYSTTPANWSGNQ